MKPKRIQLSRKKGYRKPEGAVVVARPGKWGNPFRIGEFWILRADEFEIWRGTVEDAEHAVALYRQYLGMYPTLRARAEEALRGRDLACWCPLDQPCHADVLLEVANR